MFECSDVQESEAKAETPDIVYMPMPHLPFG
jgi:hypothetical protein